MYDTSSIEAASFTQPDLLTTKVFVDAGVISTGSLYMITTAQEQANSDSEILPGISIRYGQQQQRESRGNERQWNGNGRRDYYGPNYYSSPYYSPYNYAIPNTYCIGVDPLSGNSYYYPCSPYSY